MAARKQPDGGKVVAPRKDGGSFVRSEDPLKIIFITKKSARVHAASRVHDIFRVRVAPPQLESFVHKDLKPSNILIGAGLGITDEIPADAVIEAGLPATVVRDFALASGMTLIDLGSIVGASERTISRKISSDEQLEPAESDRAYRLFDVVARAVHAFGDVEKARRWLRREVVSLGGRKPIALLRTEIGTRDVLSALDRIEFGGVA